MFRIFIIARLFLPLLLVFPIESFAQDNCRFFHPTGKPGLYFPEGQTCAVRDSIYSSTIYFENFGTFQTSPPLPVLTVTINYVQIDSITNLPCGLNWRTDRPQNAFRTRETGCIELYGLTNDTVGQYQL